MLPVDALLAGAQAHRVKTGRPLVTLSYAQSLDGSIAVRRGSPLQLSSPASMEMTHRLRAAHGGILVGIGTLLADDPRLDVRLVEGESPQPVVLDSRLRTPLEASLLRGKRPPWIAALDSSDRQKQVELERGGVRVLRLPEGADGGVSLPYLLDCLASSGMNSLMVEGGSRVISSFLSSGLVDLLVLTVTPALVGGLRAVEPAQPFPHPIRLEKPGYLSSGDDLIIWGTIR